MPGYTGGTADADVKRLRRMTNEVGSGTYTDTELANTIARYPLPDVAGAWPYLTSGSANTGWVATYDLANAAADIWEEKAGTMAGNYDFTADGASFRKEQVARNYERQASKWRSRRAISTHTQVQYPPLNSFESWIGNLAEDDD